MHQHHTSPQTTTVDRPPQPDKNPFPYQYLHHRHRHRRRPDDSLTLPRPLLRPSVARRSRRASQPLLLSLVSDAGHPATAAPEPRSLSAALLRDSLPPSARPFRQPAASSSPAHANIHAYPESLHSHDEE
ncbi:hypothetical protein AUP68_03481 [Ilyonectria robusta]